MFGLSFLSPAFLFGALVAALPIALHLIGRKPQTRVVFPAMRLLKLAPAQETRRRRLRELLLLALRVSAVFLLALAFARPYFARAAAPSRQSAVVLAIDRSFSMSAPGQFGRAVSLARRALAHVPTGAVVGLVAFDDDAQLLVRPGTDRSAVLRALDRVQPGFGGTAYAAALARASDALGPAGGHIIVVTDLQRSGWERRDAAISDRIMVSVEDAGAPASNVSVGDVRRSESGLTATVRNSGASRRTGRARLMIAGQQRAVQPFSVDAGAAQQVTFAGPLPSTGEAAVEVDDAVGYQADNAAYTLLDPPEPPSLLAITADGDPSRGAFYVQRALEVDDGRLFHLTTDSGGNFAAHAAVTQLQRYAAVLVLGTRGLDTRAAKAIGDYVEAGGGALVALDDQVESGALDQIVGAHTSFSFDRAGRGDDVRLVAADVRHPILESFDAGTFAGARFERVADARGLAGTILARFTDGRAAIVERTRGTGRLVIFCSDLSSRWNDLPLQPAFLPLVHQMARYLAGGRVPARDFLVSTVPPGVPHQPGVARVRDDSGDRRIVVNVDVRESDIGRMSSTEFEQAVARTRGRTAAAAPMERRQAEQQQGYWRWALAIAIAALLAEGLAGRGGRWQARRAEGA